MGPTDDTRTVVAALWRMSRPSQLLLVAVVYALGVAIAAGGAATGTVGPTAGSPGVGGPALSAAAGAGTAGAAPPRLAAGLLALLPVAASVHYANEYADHETDALTNRTPFSGGSGALPETGLPPRLALRAAAVALLAGAVVTAAGLAAGWLPPAAVVVLAGIALVGWAYSLPPPALAWRGFGEVTNAALGGVALPCYGYAVLVGTVRPVAVLAVLPFAVVVFVNLLETQWPDRQADALVGKWTLPTRWSRRRLRRSYLVAVGLAAAAPPLLSGWVLPPPVVLASLAPVPLLAWGARRFTRRERPLPAVLAMVGTALAQLAGWTALAAGMV